MTTDGEGRGTDQGALNHVIRIGFVQDSIELAAALDRVRAAHAAWETYDGPPTREIATDLYDAAQDVTSAMRRFQR